MRLLPALVFLALVTATVACRTRPAASAAPNAPSLAPRGTLVPTDRMARPRAAHTATPLPGGRVLVAGGMAQASATAEVYDPVAGRFVLTGDLSTPRHSHTATPLPDGRVLVAGGYGAGTTVLAAAEIYDPQTDTFAPTGSLGTARAGHTATPLPDGRVLVAGGVGDGWTFLASAEVYDPRTGTWAPTGPMALARESHVAVALPDGRVLVVGGHRGRRARLVLYREIEAYDPATGAFTPAGRLRVRRHKHDAVVLPDGRVLVTGGADERDADGRYASAEIVDPATGESTATGPLLGPRYKHAGTSVVLSDGRVVLLGGAPTAEVFDPSVGRSRSVGGTVRLAGLFSAVARLPDGRVLVTGGYGADIAPQPGAWLFTR